MKLNDKVIGIISVVLLVCFINGCVSYSTVRLPVNESIPVSKKTVILHWQNREFQITDVSFKNNQLKGVIHRRIPGYKAHNLKTIPHVFVDSSFNPPENRTERVAIDLSAITKVEVFEVQVKESLIKTAIVAGSFVAIVAIVLIIYLTLNPIPVAVAV